MIVTYKDDALVKAGILDKVENILKARNADFVVSSEIVPNPTKKNAEGGKKFALGGGSVMDATKASDFIDALFQLEKDCCVDNIDTSALGRFKKDALKYVKNAKYTNGSMFASDPVALSDEEYADIYRKSFQEEFV